MQTVARQISAVENGDTGIMIPGIAGDGSLFPVEKMQAHRDAVFHLAVSVFLFDGEELLIQRRALNKYHCGGMWANTCCTHPHWDETALDCANRRLGEELGITATITQGRVVDYQADVGNGLTEHERVTMFTGMVSKETLVIDCNPDEVAETRWITPAILRKEVQATPERFTPWLRIYLDRFPDLRV